MINFNFHNRQLSFNLTICNKIQFKLCKVDLYPNSFSIEITVDKWASIEMKKKFPVKSKKKSSEFQSMNFSSNPIVYYIKFTNKVFYSYPSARRLPFDLENSS